MEPSEHYNTRLPDWSAPGATPDRLYSMARATPVPGRARLGRPGTDGELILVAVEDGRIRAPLEKFLGLRGYRVRGVVSAAEAVDVIRTDRPAAAIVDLGEAPGPGLEVAVAMSLPRPVLMLSSTPQTTGQLARVRPRTRLVSKPCSLVMVIDLLQDMLTSAERLRRPETSCSLQPPAPARSVFAVKRPLAFGPA